MRALAIDPGLAHGWAYFSRWQNYDPHEWRGGVLEYHELGPFLRAQLDEAVDVLVVENFIITQKTLRNTQAPWSLKGIGVCEDVARMRGVPLVIQQPGDRKVVTYEDLKALGFWHPQDGGHANEAARHLVRWLVKEAKVLRLP